MKGRGKLRKPLPNNVFKMAASSLIMDEEILNSILSSTNRPLQEAKGHSI